MTRGMSSKAEQMAKASVAVWAYCLMPNHVHLIICPSTDDGLGKAIGAAHRRWAGFVNARGRWQGHLFDSRFASLAMDEAHLISAVRYVAINPVRARLAVRAEDWPWSSVRAHLSTTIWSRRSRSSIACRPSKICFALLRRMQSSPHCALRSGRGGRWGQRSPLLLKDHAGFKPAWPPKLF